MAHIPLYQPEWKGRRPLPVSLRRRLVVVAAAGIPLAMAGSALGFGLGVSPAEKVGSSTLAFVDSASHGLSMVLGGHPQVKPLSPVKSASPAPAASKMVAVVSPPEQAVPNLDRGYVANVRAPIPTEPKPEPSHQAVAPQVAAPKPAPTALPSPAPTHITVAVDPTVEERLARRIRLERARTAQAVARLARIDQARSRGESEVSPQMRQRPTDGAFTGGHGRRTGEQTDRAGRPRALR